MADIKVRINLNAGVDSDRIDSIDFNQETNNVSKSQGAKTSKNDGQNLISWGNVVKDSEGNVVSKVVNGEVVTTGLLSLADGYVGGVDATLGEQGGYNGFVFGVVPENNEYSVQFTLTGENIDSITVYGDRNSNQFPTRAYLDGDTSNYIYSDDPEWSIKFPSASNSHTITFDMWNRVNYNACITYIGVLENELVLDKKYIRSIESLSQSTGQPKEIYYGVTPSSGSFEVVDVDGELYDYIKDNVISVSDSNIDISANGKNVHKHITLGSYYSMSSKVLKCEISSNLYNKLSILMTDFYPRILSDTAYNLLWNLFVFRLGYTTSEFINFFKYDNNAESEIILQPPLSLGGSEELVTMKISDYLSSIHIDTIPKAIKCMDFVNSILTATGLNLVEMDNGDLKIFSARPFKMPYEKVINIPKQNQFSVLESDVWTNNKYTNIEMSINEISTFLGVAYESNPRFINDGGTLVLENINKTATMKKIGNEECLCFFLEINTQNTFYDFTITKEEHGVFAYDLGFNAKTYSVSNQGAYYLFDTVSTKDTYDFSQSNSSRIVVLEKESDINKTTFAVLLNLAYYYSQTGRPETISLILKMNALVCNESTKTFTMSNDNTNVCIYPKSEYLSNKTKFLHTNEELYRVIAEWVLYDYKNGIKTGTITIPCLDYYYQDGSLAKKWDNGDIVSVRDIVKIEGDETIWRVTGRNFRYSGVPMIDLELQEVRVIE